VRERSTYKYEEIVSFRTQCINFHLDLKSSANDEEADAGEGERGYNVACYAMGHNGRSDCFDMTAIYRPTFISGKIHTNFRGESIANFENNR
jgi:hypothetical protein